MCKGEKEKNVVKFTVVLFDIFLSQNIGKTYLNRAYSRIIFHDVHRDQAVAHT